MAPKTKNFFFNCYTIVPTRCQVLEEMIAKDINLNFVSEWGERMLDE